MVVTRNPTESTHSVEPSWEPDFFATMFAVSAWTSGHVQVALRDVISMDRMAAGPVMALSVAVVTVLNKVPLTEKSS